MFKQLSTKVDSRNLSKLTVLEIADWDAMLEGYGTCSELLHSAGESLNLKLPSPDEIITVFRTYATAQNMCAKSSSARKGISIVCL